MLPSIRRLLLGTLLALPSAAAAGPPYVSDDPEPTESGHWENYVYATAQGAEGQRRSSRAFYAALPLRMIRTTR